MLVDFLRFVLLFEGGNILLVLFPTVRTRELCFISFDISSRAVRKDKNFSESSRSMRGRIYYITEGLSLSLIL